MKRWLRVVLPTQFVGPYLFLYAIYAAFVWFLYSYWGLEKFAELKSSYLRLLPITVAAALYGSYRCIYFHPGFREKYLNFLKQTPWTPEKPLPLGPVTLIWQDVVVLMMLCVLLWSTNLNYLLTLFIFGMLGYQIPMSWLFYHYSMWGYFYSLLFGLGIVILLATTPVYAAILLLGMYLFCHKGLKRSLIAMHIPEQANKSQWTEMADIAFNVQSIKKAQNRLTGWPFDNLAPKKMGGIRFDG